MSHIFFLSMVLSFYMPLQIKNQEFNQDYFNDYKINLVKIGDHKFGGIVFFVDESGRHGLVCSLKSSLVLLSPWRVIEQNLNTRAKGDGIYSGKLNTALIISSQVAFKGRRQKCAAQICNDLNEEGYGDWYLPSKMELNLIYEKLVKEDKLKLTTESNFFWSSTEYYDNLAWRQNLVSGIQVLGSKYNEYSILPIRKF